MPPEELEALMAKLTAWCEQKHGRQKELADYLHVSEDTISHWKAGRKKPGLEKYLVLKAFLAKKHRQRSR
jgi:DNA-binding transcriptional regulator YiaG